MPYLALGRFVVEVSSGGGSSVDGAPGAVARITGRCGVFAGDA